MLKKFFRGNQLARQAKVYLDNISSLGTSPTKHIATILNQFEGLTVLDVGANIGQFGLDLRRSGYAGPIESFEPVTESFNRLEKCSLGNQPWAVTKMALGAEPGVSKMNISGNSGLSSSFLRMEDIHEFNFPESKYVGVESVQVSTIDDEINRLKLTPDKIFLKIDVQGFESFVIKGAEKSLPSIPFSFIEVSLRPMYEGELTLREILNMLNSYNHEVIDVFRGVKDKSGNLLQVDILARNWV